VSSGLKAALGADMKPATEDYDFLIFRKDFTKWAKIS
jgi:hypothetical protein